MKKITFLLLTALLLLSLVFGCSASTASDAVAPAEPGYDTSEGQYPSEKGEADYGYNGAPASTPQPAPSADPNVRGDGDEAGGTGTFVPDPSRKMIWNGELQLETTDFTRSVNALYSLIEESGGFIQSSAVTGEGRNSGGEARLRNARYTIRIPSENFQLFLNGSGEVATILLSNTNAQDVTAAYFDTESRLKVLRIKEGRLIEMLEQTEKVEYKDELQYILQLENELSNVRYEIESLTGTLRKYDDLISYSTITVYLNEVREYTATPAEPASVGERISQRFMASLKNVGKAAGDFIVWLIGYSPILIIIAAGAIGLYFIIRSATSRKKSTHTPPPPDDK